MVWAVDHLLRHTLLFPCFRRFLGPHLNLTGRVPDVPGGLIACALPLFSHSTEGIEIMRNS